MSERTIDEASADRVAIERWESEGGKTLALERIGLVHHRDLGATADQLDPARDRVRSEIGGAALSKAAPG